MEDRDARERLAKVIPTVRSHITKHRGSRRFNEQITKASLIVPVLDALGWNASDPEEVQWEYKPKPRYNPVDFALMLKRTPCLFIEAKALRESLSDDKLVAQILTYASVAGVQWAILTNGDEYRIYNANAPVPVEEKLFRTMHVSSDATSAVLGTLSLLSKENLQDKKIGRLWESHFVDRQVKVAMEELLNPEDPARTVIRAIKKLSDGKLRDSDIRASLQRARLQIDFPEEPEDKPRKARARKRAKKGGHGAAAKSSVGLEALVAAGILRPPVEITTRYRKQELRATVEKNGEVSFEGTRYSSLSTAGGMARKPFHKGDLKGRPYPQTNGWTFWQIRDPETGQLIPIDLLRDRFLDRKKSEAGRFLKKA